MKRNLKHDFSRAAEKVSVVGRALVLLGSWILAASAALDELGNQIIEEAK